MILRGCLVSYILGDFDIHNVYNAIAVHRTDKEVVLL